MDSLEILFIIKESVGWIFFLPFIVSLFYFFPGFYFAHDKGPKNFKSYIRYWKSFSIILVISLFILAFPTTKTLWKVRIGLIKYNLANKANLEKGAEIIERLGHKLECKYLGCSKDDKPKED